MLWDVAKRCDDAALRTRSAGAEMGVEKRLSEWSHLPVASGINRIIYKALLLCKDLCLKGRM